MKLSKNSFSSAFKAKIACEALRESKSLNEISSANGVHPTQITKWKKVVVEDSKTLFDRKGQREKHGKTELAELQRIVGEQTIQLAWYKKKLGNSN